MVVRRLRCTLACLVAVACGEVAERTSETEHDASAGRTGTGGDGGTLTGSGGADASAGAGGVADAAVAGASATSGGAGLADAGTAVTECSEDTDCPADPNQCVTPRCGADYRCTTEDKEDGASCSAVGSIRPIPGTCQSGLCVGESPGGCANCTDADDNPCNGYVECVLLGVGVATCFAPDLPPPGYVCGTDPPRVCNDQQECVVAGCSDGGPDANCGVQDAGNGDGASTADGAAVADGAP